MPTVISLPAVAALESNGGARCVLWADHLVGRAPEAALRLENPSVSWRHASLRWTGQVWELQDLGSLNGTFLDGSRIAAGARVPLRTGSRVRFGGDVEWLLADSDPPSAVAVALDDGARLLPRDGLLALPDADHPDLTIHRQFDGSWIAEGPDRVWTPEADEIVSASGKRFRFEPGGVVLATAAGAARQPSPSTIQIEFAVSLNEEHVELTVVRPNGERTSLRPRAHTYLLLTLARARLLDAEDPSLPPTSHGWIDQPSLLKMLATSSSQLALDIYRARRQFTDAGVVDSAHVIERRPTSRELRIGVSAIAVRVV